MGHKANSSVMSSVEMQRSWRPNTTTQRTFLLWWLTKHRDSFKFYYFVQPENLSPYKEVIFDVSTSCQHKIWPGLSFVYFA